MIPADVRLLEWNLFLPHRDRLVACVTTRGAGFNLALHVGDDSGAVVTRRKSLCDNLGFPFRGFTCAEQVHGAECAMVEPAMVGRGRADHAGAFRGADALLVREPGALLVVFLADCAPIALYDPVHNALAVVHAGWRGTAARIAARAVEEMSARFGSIPADLMAGIGPCIGPCCYTIGKDVATALGSGAIARAAAGAFRADLAATNAAQLVRAGLSPRRIESMGYCTACRADLFFSHRAEKGKTGRFALVAGLRE